jgi:hypothetical protein
LFSLGEPLRNVIVRVRAVLWKRKVMTGKTFRRLREQLSLHCCKAKYGKDFSRKDFGVRNGFILHRACDPMNDNYFQKDTRDLFPTDEVYRILAKHTHSNLNVILRHFDKVYLFMYDQIDETLCNRDETILSKRIPQLHDPYNRYTYLGFALVDVQNLDGISIGRVTFFELVPGFRGHNLGLLFYELLLDKFGLPLLPHDPGMYMDYWEHAAEKKVRAFQRECGKNGIDWETFAKHTLEWDEELLNQFRNKKIKH